jgi:hypothetical protein
MTDTPEDAAMIGFENAHPVRAAQSGLTGWL